MVGLSKAAVLALSVVLSLPGLAQTASPSGTAATQLRGGAYDQQIQQDVDKFLRDNDKLNERKGYRGRRHRDAELARWTC